MKNVNVNTDKIKGLIVEKKLSTRKVSVNLNLTSTSLLRRLRRERDFTADEIFKLSILLKEPITIFFK